MLHPPQADQVRPGRIRITLNSRTGSNLEHRDLLAHYLHSTPYIERYSLHDSTQNRKLKDSIYAVNPYSHATQTVQALASGEAAVSDPSAIAVVGWQSQV